MSKIGFRIRSQEKLVSIYVYVYGENNQRIEKSTGLITNSYHWDRIQQRSKDILGAQRSINFWTRLKLNLLMGLIYFTPKDFLLQATGWRTSCQWYLTENPSPMPICFSIKSICLLKKPPFEIKAWKKKLDLESIRSGIISH